MDVSIIIVNYKAKEQVLDAIRSIKERTSDKIGYEIIVVDNASDDGIVGDIKSLYPDVITIENSSNIGFARANNLGLDIAKGRYIFYLNPDTILLSDAVSILSSYLDDNPGCGMCGGNLVTSDNKPNQSFMFMPSLYNEILALMPNFIKRDRFNSSKLYNYTDIPLKVESLSGADMMCRRDICRFSSDFFVYYEDCELSYKVQKSGYSVEVIPDVKIIHLQGVSSGTSLKRFSMLQQSKYVFYSLTHSTRYAYMVYYVTTFIYKLYIIFGKKYPYKEWLKIANQEFNCFLKSKI